jgi:hypothetical protein
MNGIKYVESLFPEMLLSKEALTWRFGLMPYGRENADAKPVFGPSLKGNVDKHCCWGHVHDHGYGFIYPY